MQKEPSDLGLHPTSTAWGKGVEVRNLDEQTASLSRVILMVDDDPIILMNTAALLEDLGHRVFEAGSGAEALELLAANAQIDLLITDQSMPEMLGTDLIAAARAFRPSLPVILATGYSAETIDGTLNVTRLAKPFSFAELEAAVKRVGA